jgi:hypothetical protein
MCVAKSPKIEPQSAAPPKPIIIRNPYLDGGDPSMRSTREGRNSLKIPRGLVAAVKRSPAASPAAPRTANLDPATDAFGRPLKGLAAAIKPHLIAKGWAPSG